MEIGSSEGGDRKAYPKISQREIELIRFRDAKTPIQFKLMTDEVIEGVVQWFDDYAVHIVDAEGIESTVMLNVVSYYGRRR